MIACMKELWYYERVGLRRWRFTDLERHSTDVQLQCILRVLVATPLLLSTALNDDTILTDTSETFGLYHAW